MWKCGVCAVWRFASKVQLEQRLKAKPRTSKLNQKIRRLKLLSACLLLVLYLVFLGVYFVVVGWVVVLMLEVCL